MTVSLELVVRVNRRVAGIGLQSHDLGLKLLLEVYLSGVDEVARLHCAVGGELPLGENLDVDVDSAGSVKAWKDGLHLHHAVVIRGPHST